MSLENQTGLGKTRKKNKKTTVTSLIYVHEIGSAI